MNQHYVPRLYLKKIEKFYSDYVEPLFKRAYNLLSNDKQIQISTEQRLTILLGVSSLDSRNPIRLKYSVENYRNQINELYNLAIRNNETKIQIQSKEFNLEEWSADKILKCFIEKLTKEFKEKHLNDIRLLVEFHKDARFEVSKIKDYSTIITSDNPLVLEDLEK